MKPFAFQILSCLLLFYHQGFCQIPIAEIDGTVKASELLLYDSIGDLRFRINADEGTFSMLKTDTVWYSESVKSKHSEERLMNIAGWTMKDTIISKNEIVEYVTVWKDLNGTIRKKTGQRVDEASYPRRVDDINWHYDESGEWVGGRLFIYHLKKDAMVAIFFGQDSTKTTQIEPAKIELTDSLESPVGKLIIDPSSIQIFNEPDTNTIVVSGLALTKGDTAISIGFVPPRWSMDSTDAHLHAEKNGDKWRWNLGPGITKVTDLMADSINSRIVLTDSVGVTSILQSDGIMPYAAPFVTNFGDLFVSGILSKLAGSFKIDHPIDPYNKYLSHSFVESPDMMNVYNGNIYTDENGKAIVTLPDYFETLNIDFRYQLTVIETFAQAIISNEIHNNCFEIMTDKPHVKVSWQVTGVRNDNYARENRIQVEVNKEPDKVGTLLYNSEKLAQVNR